MQIEAQVEKSFEMGRETSQYLLAVSGAALAFLASIAHEPKSLTLCGVGGCFFKIAIILLALSMVCGCLTLLKFNTLYAGAKNQQPDFNEHGLRRLFSSQILILLAGIGCSGAWLLTQI